MRAISFRDRPMTMARGLRMVLVAQCVIAGLLALSDAGTRLMPRGPGDVSVPSGPVSPGDQVRRYRPDRSLPGQTRPSAPPGIELPNDLPSRLEFTQRDADGFGSVILLNGAIETGDADRLDAFLAGMEGELPAIALNSPGGSVFEALAIGRMLRARDADTVILPGTACFSACPYILAAGIERTVSKLGAVGLHQHYYDTPGYVPAYFAVEDIQHGQGQTMAYLIEMGIDTGLMIHSLNTPPDDIYILVEEELIESRLATEMID